MRYTFGCPGYFNVVQSWWKCCPSVKQLELLCVSSRSKLFAYGTIIVLGGLRVKQVSAARVAFWGWLFLQYLSSLLAHQTNCHMLNFLPTSIFNVAQSCWKCCVNVKHLGSGWNPKLLGYSMTNWRDYGGQPYHSSLFLFLFQIDQLGEITEVKLVETKTDIVEQGRGN